MGAGLSSLALAVAVPLGGGIAGSFATMKSVKTWYKTLKRPPWTPPDWLFGPAWTVLYTTMGVASWRVARLASGGLWSAPMAAYAAQLALNFAWSPLFFGAKRTDLALVDIAGMEISIALTTKLFWEVDPVAGGLMLPYLAWVTFAAALNARIYLDNPGNKPPPGYVARK